MVVHLLKILSMRLKWMNYLMKRIMETLAGFMMYRLRKIPRPADFVEFGGYKFEVVDVDHFKIDQLLVTRVLEKMIYHLHLMKVDLFWCKISCKCRIFFDK